MFLFPAKIALLFPPSSRILRVSSSLTSHTLQCFSVFKPSSNFNKNMASAQLYTTQSTNLNSYYSPTKKQRIEERIIMKFSKVYPEAHAPTKGSSKAAGFDLKSAVDITVPARGKALVDTGIKVELPTGCYGRVAPRSGLAVGKFIDVGAGVIDEDYRGILKVVLFNHSDIDFEVKNGDRIAQLICERIYYPELEEVDDLTKTERGEGGFGSTGV